MRKDIHPTYHPKAKTTCSCKNVIYAGSTQEDLHVEICSACHPFYTGKQKLVDTAGRVNKFLERQKKAEAAQKKSAEEKKTKKKAE